MFADVPAACAPSVLLATMTLFMCVYDDDEFCSRYSRDEMIRHVVRIVPYSAETKSKRMCISLLYSF